MRKKAVLDKIKLIKNNRLAKNSFIVFVGTFIAGIGGYIYNMLMSRMLGPADYGIMASLVSLLYIISVISGTLGIVVSRAVAEYSAHGKLSQAKYFIDKANKFLIAIGLAVFILFVLASPWVASFLNISSLSYVVMLGLVSFVSFVGTVNSSSLGGLQRFVQLSINGVLSVAAKIIFGVLFVWAGWSVNGAMGALAVSTIIAIIHAYYYLRLPKESVKTKIELCSIMSYAVPVFLATFCITSIYNIDVILVKHYFDAETAGHYSILSLLGKIVFFITGSVGAVLFPTIVERHSRNEKYSHILRYSMFMVLAGSLAVTASYFIMPNFIIRTLFGSSYLPVAPYLGCFGIVMTLFSLSNLLVVYNLSIKKTKFIPILFTGLIFEVGLIYIYHSSIWQIIYALLFSMAFILFFLLVFQNAYKNDKIVTREQRG